jgi:copper chaperone CopZ
VEENKRKEVCVGEGKKVIPSIYGVKSYRYSASSMAEVFVAALVAPVGVESCIAKVLVYQKIVDDYRYLLSIPLPPESPFIHSHS